MNTKPVLGFIASSFLFIGCGGGGGSDGTSSTPPPAPVATKAGGVWEGTATSSGTTIEFAGVVTEDGEGRFVDDSGTQYVIDSLGGSDGNVSLNFTAIAQVGFTFVDGSTVTTGSLTGAIVERSSFNADYSVATGESGTISMTYNPIYERDSSLDKLTGSWDEEFGVATFDPDGSFYEQDSFGCVYDGQASLIDPQYNAYGLEMTVSLCGADANGQYSGVGTLADFNTTDDLFILQMNSDAVIFTTALQRL